MLTSWKVAFCHATINNTAKSFHLCLNLPPQSVRKTQLDFTNVRALNFCHLFSHNNVLANFSLLLSIQDIFIALCLKERRYFPAVLLSPYTCRSVLQTTLCAPKQGYEQMEITATCSDSHFPLCSFPAATTSVQITSCKSVCTFHLQLPLRLPDFWKSIPWMQLNSFYCCLFRSQEPSLQCSLHHKPTHSHGLGSRTHLHVPVCPGQVTANMCAHIFRRLYAKMIHAEQNEDGGLEKVQERTALKSSNLPWQYLQQQYGTWSLGGLLLLIYPEQKTLPVTVSHWLCILSHLQKNRWIQPW